MTLWRNFVSFMAGAGWRQPGQQTGQPGHYGTRTPTPVTLDTAMQLSTVFACMRLISETIGSLPLILYEKKTNRERVPVYDHPLSVLFSGCVNKWQTRQEFFESITYQLAGLGNNYAAIQRNSSKQIIGLVPLMSMQVQPSLLDDGSIV